LSNIVKRSWDKSPHNYNYIIIFHIIKFWSCILSFFISFDRSIRPRIQAGSWARL